MKLETEIQHDITVIRVIGELTAETAGRIRTAVDEAFNAGRRDFVVELSKVTDVDSVGLEALTALQRQCEEQLGLVRFCGANKTLSKIFELTRLDRQFTLHVDEDEALAAFVQA